MTKSSPYQDLPRTSFWRHAVSNRPPTAITSVSSSGLKLKSGNKVMTAGSCFAQHIAARLKTDGFNVLDYETGPKRTSRAWLIEHGFDTYSARYGNIYYARQLRQLIEEAEGVFAPTDWIWAKGGRFYDALRPSVEPNGWGSESEVVAQRREHLQAVRGLIRHADVFVFTLGLTEGWEHIESGTVYPTAPGTIAGSWDPATVRFHNFDYSEIVQDMQHVFNMVRNVNNGIQFLLTVSPVALAATATQQNVLVANSHSKATLRSVAGFLSETFTDVHYFPSYDLITGSNSGIPLYEANQRTVHPDTVDFVMGKFMEEMVETVPHLNEEAEPSTNESNGMPSHQEFEDILCEESLLEDFSK